MLLSRKKQRLSYNKFFSARSQQYLMKVPEVARLRGHSLGIASPGQLLTASFIMSHHCSWKILTLLTVKSAVLTVGSVCTGMSQISAELTAESARYASKAKDLYRQVAFQPLVFSCLHMSQIQRVPKWGMNNGFKRDLICVL